VLYKVRTLTVEDQSLWTMYLTFWKSGTISDGVKAKILKPRPQPSKPRPGPLRPSP